MDRFKLCNEVRLDMSQVLLLLYRYLTGIYTLGDLSFVQFLSGYMARERDKSDGYHVLTVSGNGIGELEKMLCLQWNLGHLDTMAVNPTQMGLMRFLMETSSNEVTELFSWAQGRLKGYPGIQLLLDTPGLVSYWQHQCELWKLPELEGRVALYGGSPWDLPLSETYDAILFSHTQKVLCASDPKQLLTRLKPGGYLASMMPVVFCPDSVQMTIPSRFPDLPVVKEAKNNMRLQAEGLGYVIPDGEPARIKWDIGLKDTAQLVSFSIASPLRSLLIGELLIQSLAAELPEVTRLTLLESNLDGLCSGTGSGTEALMILLSKKGV